MDTVGDVLNISIRPLIAHLKRNRTTQQLAASFEVHRLHPNEMMPILRTVPVQGIGQILEHDLILFKQPPRHFLRLLLRLKKETDGIANITPWVVMIFEPLALCDDLQRLDVFSSCVAYI